MDWTKMESPPAVRPGRRLRAVWLVRGVLVGLAASVLAAASGRLFERLAARGDAAHYPPPGDVRLPVQERAVGLDRERDAH
jgi:hypothetical protein